MQDLTEGDVVEFPRNEKEWRFGVVMGGFGMNTQLSGSMIIGVFGRNPQEAIANYKMHLAKTNITTSLSCEGHTRRQPCRVVGHVNPKTGELEKSIERTNDKNVNMSIPY